MPAGSADDTTRYLCAATYLDPAYAKTAIREFLVEPTRPVPPSPGLDAGRVLTEAVRSRVRLKLYDALLLLVMLVFVIMAWGDVLLYVWIGLSILVSLPEWFGAVKPGEQKSLSPKGIAAIVGGLVLLYLVFHFASGLSSTLSGGISLSADYYDSSSGSSGGDTVKAVIAVLLALVGGGVVVHERWTLWQLLTTRFRRGATGDSGSGSTTSFLTEDFSEELGRYRRMGELESGGGTPLIVYRGYNPFVGSGLHRTAWSMAIPLERLPEDERDPETERPLTTASMYAQIRGAIELLRTGGVLSPDQRLGGLRVNESVFTSAAELIDHQGTEEARLFLPDTRYAPHGRLPDDEVERIRLAPREWARYFQCFQVETWDRDLVLSTYLHLAVNETTLYLEWTTCMLPPIRAGYRAVDKMRPNSYRPIGQGLLQWLKLPASVPGRLVNLCSWIRSPKREPGVLDSDRYGSSQSLRELASVNLFSNYFQLVDIERYEKIIESRLLPAIGDLLDEAGFSTAKFDEQASTVVNTTTVLGDNNGSIDQGGNRGKRPPQRGNPPTSGK
jgi:hypothetical protein